MIEMKKEYYTIYNPKHSVASLNTLVRYNDI